MEWIKYLLIVLLLGAIGSLAIGMRHLTSADPEKQKKVVIALTWRIGLSVLIFLLIIILSYFEVIKPHSLPAISQ